MIRRLPRTGWTFAHPLGDDMTRRYRCSTHSFLPKRILAAGLSALVLLLAGPAGAQTTTTALTTTPSPVAPGGRLAYVATLINDGTTNKDFDLSFTFDPNLAFLGAVAKAGSSNVAGCRTCNAPVDCVIGGCRASGLCELNPSPCVVDISGGAGSHWKLGNLPAGQAVSLQLEQQVSAPDGESLDTSLLASTYRDDGTLGPPAPANAVTSVVAGAGAAPLFVDFSGTPREVQPGEELAYRLVVINRGAFRRELDVFLDYDSHLTFVDFQTDSPVCLPPFCPSTFVSPVVEPDRDFLIGIDPGETITLRLRTTVALGTLRTELESDATLVDRNTSRGVSEGEVTTVLVCDAALDGAPCDNGDVCPADTCSGGSCIATACPEACNGAPDGAPCADADACSVEECRGGQCVARLSSVGSPVRIRCNACQVCDPAQACVTALAVGNVCRPAFGSCDAAELCDGVDRMCPEDVFQPLQSVCDDGNPETVEDQCVPQAGEAPRCVGSPDPCGNGVVDPGEACDDGNDIAGDCCSPSCQFEAAGTACADSTVCNGDETCDGAGSCQPGQPLVCDAGTVCATSGVCDAVEGCVFDPAPAPGCHDGFDKAALVINETKQGFEKLSLKLINGPELDQADFGDPTVAGGTAYTVCLYRADDGAFAGDLQLDRAGQDCGRKPCWQSVPPRSFRYKDRDHQADGIGALKFRGGPAGKSRISLVGRNNAKKGQLALPAGTDPAAPGLATGLDRSFDGALIQIRRDDGGACFEASIGNVIRSGPTNFKGKN